MFTSTPTIERLKKESEKATSIFEQTLGKLNNVIVSLREEMIDVHESRKIAKEAYDRQIEALYDHEKEVANLLAKNERQVEKINEILV